MARGGIYDQLGGGFSRYSVDAEWVVPHFEKMLYDNALLLRFYAHWARRTGSDLATRVTEETARFLLSDLLTENGCFASALDADTDGIEGLTYVWTPAQLVEVLGAEDGQWAADLFRVTDTGTFEEGASVLQLLRDPDDWSRWQRVSDALRAVRAGRPQPGRDDKVVTAWNGLTVTALTEAGLALDRPDWIAAAAECAGTLLDLHLVDGHLRRASSVGLSVPRRACSRITQCWPPASWLSTRQRDWRGGSMRRSSCSTSLSTTSLIRPSREAGSTRPISRSPRDSAPRPVGRRDTVRRFERRRGSADCRGVDRCRALVALRPSGGGRAREGDAST
ncbi:hypothetical protein GCM10020255_097640 [Rhodococcus baikonurensis]